MKIEMKENKLVYCPWGRVQKVEKITRGLTRVFTSGHGGYMLSAALAKKILSEIAIKNASKYNNDNYYCYEEDLAWALMYRDILELPDTNKVRISLEKYESETSGSSRNTLLESSKKIIEKYYSHQI